MKFRRTLLLVLSSLTLIGEAVAQQSATTYRVSEYVNTINPNEPARMSASNIFIVGRPNKARAMSRFGGATNGATPLAECGNYYKQVLGEGVNIYVAAIPLSSAYYTPRAATSWTKSQAAAINAMYAALNKGVNGVDVYTALSKHVSESIYLRTDHHWAPLGGYYAAEAFAKVAGVPFRDLSHYQEVVIPNYVGSMYSYTKDNAIRTSPENFVYHKPQGVEYTTTYITYHTDANRRIVGQSRPTLGSYFVNLRGGGAYCTFMGGDSKITQVRTATKNGRRLVIVKDSFGNTIPGYLFYSFEEIHVIDFRYFNKNLKRYVQENKITDVLLASSVTFGCSTSTMSRYRRLLVQ